MSAETSRVDRALSSYDEEVKKAEESFSQIPKNIHDKTWVKKKLQQMYDVDQYMRSQMDLPSREKFSETEAKEFMLKFLPRFQALDRRDTADMKEILSIYHWIKISEFGDKADNQAWLIVQHADLDVEFQKMVLKRLEGLYPINETKPSNYAYLVDRIASSSNDPTKQVPQRYGTQGRCTKPGEWTPWPSEDEKNLDLRRASVGLGTEADYIRFISKMCH